MEVYLLLLEQNVQFVSDFFMKEYLEPNVGAPVGYLKLYCKHRRTACTVHSFLFYIRVL